jgi:transposase InsO family protein
MMRAVDKAIARKGVSGRSVCRALGLARSSHARWRSRPAGPDTDGAERAALLKIATKRPTCGGRTLLRHMRRRGITIGIKRVRRLMREEHLVVRRRKRFVATTNSDHGLGVYPNLAKGLALTGVNQLWVADLTYVHLGEGFIYVAVILDAFSRKVIGWAISRSLEAAFAVDALRKALRRRGAPKGLVHHSDRGVQYACHAYTGLLKGRGVAISMSAKGNPYDNAKAESFMKTFKCDEVHLMDYADEADARKRIATFLERVYNKERLHSALGYLPPTEFEQALAIKSTDVKEDTGRGGLDPASRAVRQQPSAGETEAGSAGMQPARDIRPGLRRKTQGAAPKRRPQTPTPPSTPLSNGSPMPQKIQPREAPFTAPGCQ